MATTVLFDTDAFVSTLEKAEVPSVQAKAQKEALRSAMAEAFEAQAKTQQDITSRAVETLDAKTEKALLRLEHKIDSLEQRLENKIDTLESRLVFKLGRMFVISVGIIIAAIGLAAKFL